MTEALHFLPLTLECDAARRLAFLDVVLQRLARGEPVGHLPFDPLRIPLPVIEFLVALHTEPAADAAYQEDRRQ